MVLGAGEMAELALESSAADRECARRSSRTARSSERQSVAERYGATAMHYDECWTALANVDVLVCSTAAPRHVVFAEHVRPALGARGDRPLCILDIALPRDVDPSVGELENVFLYNLDDLQAVVSRESRAPASRIADRGTVDRGEVGEVLGLGRRPGGRSRR